MLKNGKQSVEEKKNYLAPKFKKYCFQEQDVLGNASQQGTSIGDYNYDVNQDDDF